MSLMVGLLGVTILIFVVAIALIAWHFGAFGGPREPECI